MAISLGSIGPGQSGEAQRRVDPAAFGVGIGRAIGGLAEAATNYSNSQAVVSEAEQSLSLAFQGRQDKVDRSLADIGLIQVQAKLQRDLAQLQDTMPLGAAGYTEQAQKLTDAAFKGYLQTVPERIRTEYTPRAAAAGTDLVDGAFNFQLNAQDNAFRLTTTDIAQSAIDSIASGAQDLSYWKPIIEKSFGNSTLDAAETSQLYEKVMAAVESADLKKLALAIALDPASGVGHTGGPEDGSDVVAAGLPGEYRAVLNAIAGVESPGYDVRNGGERFPSYADHPGTGFGAGGTSSAAGRYQIIYATWKRAQKALGLTDFSPESQDRAAVWIAEQDYKARTGRNLQPDLQSGDHGLIEGVRKTLAGQGKENVTWEGLQHLSPDDFFAAVTGQEGTMSALLASPEYSHMTYAERQANIGDAQAFAAQLTAQKAAAQNAKVESTIAELKNMAVTGSPDTGSMIELLGPGGDGTLSAEKYVEVKTFLAGQDQSRHDANIFFDTMNGGRSFDPTNPKDASSYAAMFQRDWMGALASGDQEIFTNRILPFVAKVNAIPPGMQSQLASLSTSSNPKIADFALQAILALKDRSPTAFAQMSKDSQDAALFYRTHLGNMPQDQLLATVKNMNDPANAQQRLANQSAGNSFITSKDNMGKFSTETLVSSIIGNVDWGKDTVSNSQEISAALQSEVIVEFQHQMSFYANPQKAYEAAVELVGKNWGRTGVGASGIMMRRPPEKAYPNMPPEQMQLQLDEAFPNAEGETTRLVSDQRTEQDIAAGKPASYSIVRTGTDGSILPIMMDQSGAPRPSAARVYFDPAYRTGAQQVKLATDVETQNAFRDPANSPYQPETENYIQDPTIDPSITVPEVSAPVAATIPNLTPEETQQYNKLNDNLERAQAFIKKYPEDGKERLKASEALIRDFKSRIENKPTSSNLATFNPPPGASPNQVQKYRRLHSDVVFTQDLAKKYPASTAAVKALKEAEAAFNNFKWD